MGHQSNNTWPHELFKPLQILTSCTLAALGEVVNDLLCAADPRYIHILILLDPSAALEAVCDQILTDCMDRLLGVSGTPLAWFHSYIIDNGLSPVATQGTLG